MKLTNTAQAKTTNHPNSKYPEKNHENESKANYEVQIRTIKPRGGL